MYKILRSDGAVLYDINDPNTRPVTEPKGTFEIGQPGSVQFALVPAHPLYDEVGIMKTYVSVLRENAEIFYGRIIDVNVDKITGIKRIECAGALQFLDDGELPPVTNPTDSSKGVDLTASAFFTRCIEAYNAEIGNDPKRVLSVGTVSHAKAQMTKTYHLTGYTKVKNALDSNLISEYGGYFRVRKSGNTHVIDWLDTYSEPNTSPIELRENIQNQENAISAGDFFTMIRPSGKNNMVLSPVAMSSELVNEYGRIIKSVNFKDEETEEGLNEAVTEYIAETAKGAGKTATIKLVDMHFLDGSIPVIRMGSTYTNIAGFEGEPMVVSGMELNFANFADDSITLKNAKDLESGSKGSVTSKGSIAKETSGSKGFQNIWQHITEGEDWLRLFADRIEINAQNLVEVVGTFERYAQETTETIQIQGQEITAIHGTGVLQNSDQITQVAGMFSSKYYLVPVASRTGRNPSTAGWYEATQYQVSENDINSGIELFPSVSAALSGRAINTASGLTPYIGQWVTRMVHTSDTTPTVGKNYYTKSLGLLDGASFMLTEEGSETNVGELLKETSEGVGENERQIALIEGSALWIHRDQITGVTGEYEIVTAADGTKTLVIKSGGGLKIRKNNAEYGIYDEDSLTAGVMIKKINGNQTETHITGNKIYVGNGASANEQLSTWAADSDGLFATNISALQGRISSIEADYITADTITGNFITSRVGAANSMTIGSLSAGDITSSGVMTAATLVATAFTTSTLYMGGVYLTPGNLVASVVGSAVTGGGYKFTVTQADGTSVDYPFNVASSITFSGAWTGASYTATAKDPDDNVLGRVTTAISRDWSGTTLRIVSGTDILLSEAITGGTGLGASTQGTSYTINTFNSSHRAYGYVDAASHPAGRLFSFNVDASSVYSDGWEDSAGAIVWPSAGTATSFVVGFKATPDATVTNRTFTMTKGTPGASGYASVNYNNQAVARIDISDWYTTGRTDGAASVTLTTGSWSGGLITVTASNGEEETIGFPAVTMDQGSFAGHKKWVYAYSNEAGISGYVQRLEVDATSEYTAGQTNGRAGVTLSAAGWQGGSNVVSASNGESVTVTFPAVTMGQDSSFSSHKKWVYAYSNAAGITGYVQRLEVDASSEYEAGVQAGSSDYQTAFDAGWSAYWNSSYWGNSSAGGLTYINRPGATPTSGSVTWFTIMATAAVAFNSTSKKFVATGAARSGGGTAFQTATAESGVISCTVTQTYNANTHKYTATGTAYEGSSALVSGSKDTGTEAYTAGYNKGWDDAVGMMGTSGAYIYGPSDVLRGSSKHWYTVSVTQGQIIATWITGTTYALTASSSAYIDGVPVDTDDTSRNLTA